MPCPRTQQANLPACSPHPPLNAERQAGKQWIPYFLKSFGMTRLDKGIKSQVYRLRSGRSNHYTRVSQTFRLSVPSGQFIDSLVYPRTSANIRVTIFLKAKIGTMVGEFLRDEIYGPSNLFFAKSGTLRCGSGLDLRRRVKDAKIKRKIGVISKKKKGHHHLGCTINVNFNPLSVKLQ